MNQFDIITGIGVNIVWLLVGVIATLLAKIVTKKGAARAILGWPFNKQNAVVVGAPLGIPPGTYAPKRDEGMPIFGLGPIACCPQNLAQRTLIRRSVQYN